MPNILEKIVATKRTEIAVAKAKLPEAELRAMTKDTPPRRDFFGALAAEGPIKLIAEVKKASPSKGIIRADFDPVAIAQTYAASGATCLVGGWAQDARAVDHWPVFVPALASP